MTFVECIVRKTDKTGITAKFKANNSIKVRHFMSIAPKSYIMYYMKANSIEFLGKKRNEESLYKLNCLTYYYYFGCGKVIPNITLQQFFALLITFPIN